MQEVGIMSFCDARGTCAGKDDDSLEDLKKLCVVYIVEE